jgi:translation initiation factor 3 subunit E
MAEHDLTQTIIPYLDRHLAFPLLTHLAETTLFPVEQIIKAQYELTNGTNMVDYSVNLFEQLNPDAEVPPGIYFARAIRTLLQLRSF